MMKDRPQVADGESVGLHFGVPFRAYKTSPATMSRYSWTGMDGLWDFRSTPE